MKKLITLLLFLSALQGYGQILLTNTTHTLEVVTTSASDVDYEIN